MNISLELVKELRSLTSAGISDCKKTLEEAGGDIKKAVEILKKKGLEIVAKKQDRQTKEGRIEAYVHLGNKIGVLVEVNCETDFVARNESFCQFTKDLAMQIAALGARYIQKEDVPKDVIIDKYQTQEQFYKENCLLEQIFIKDAAITMQDYLNSLIAKIGENIVIKRFVRFKLGEE